MKIRMKRTAMGAVDGGKRTLEFKEGQEYEVEIDLAQVFLALDHAEQVKEPHATEPGAPTEEPHATEPKAKFRK